MTDPTGRAPIAERDTLEILEALERKLLWLSSWTIHHANYVRAKDDDLKIGGHQASSASLVAIMTALYFRLLRPQDRVAVKPHASPVFHAIQYLLGRQTREKLENFRGLGGAQSYPSRTKDSDDVDFSTGSVGLGVAMTAFASLAQDYIRDKGWAGRNAGTEQGRMIALVGDAELDEGNVFEALLEGYKHDLRNCWWIIDYNRQSLDGVIHEGLKARFEEVFRAMGWDIVTLKYGRKLEAAFAEPGGAALRRWIDDCPNALFSTLAYRGGDAWRKHLLDDLGDDRRLRALIERLDDASLAGLMTNLAGHDQGSILETLGAIDHDRPVCVIAYTIKGYGLPFAGHKDNHAGLMNEAQMAEFRTQCGVREGHEWDRFEGLDIDPTRLDAFLKSVPFDRKGPRRYRAPRIALPALLKIAPQRVASTQESFGRVLTELARGDSEAAARIVTTSPDVTVSTNLGGWVNRRGVYRASANPDMFRLQQVVSAQKWDMGPEGQHIELGIAENNLFLMLAALGLSHSLFGERLLPVGTLYDPFIQRGLDALNYACYQEARFILVATPSGITLAPEGGAHQSISTPLIGMAQDGLAMFEPAFADELAAILGWSFDYIQRDGSGESEQNWLRDETGGSVYLRLSTRPVEQPQRTLDEELHRAIIDGGYWMRPPGPNCEIVIAYSGVVAPEAMTAAGLIAEDRPGVGVLAVTSADRLNAGWHAAERARQRGAGDALAHVERLLARVPREAGLVTVLDGHPTGLSWLGSVMGHRVKPLGVEHFGQTGSIAELYKRYGIDADAIVNAASAVAPGRPIRHLRALEG
jgi:pyruvate dehydrogenase E1 component